MILKIRNSRFSKAVSLLMALVFILTLNPTGTFALTGGPAQPEFNSFTPIGTSDMVDLASGDFSYNIPLMDIGGFPINLAYSSGVTMDQEASWVGLGWDLSIGQINRQMRGLPDDFDGDEVKYENNVKPNTTVGGTFQFSPELFGFKLEKDAEGVLDTVGNAKLSISASYNTYTGFSLSPSFGISFDIAGSNSIGLNATSGPDGMVLSPSLSLSNKYVNKNKAERSVNATYGVSFNSRQGISNFNLSADISKPLAKVAKLKDASVGGGSIGSNISMVPNTYSPSIQAKMQSANVTFNAAIDGTGFGVKGEAEVTGYVNTQFIINKEEIKPVYGYDNTEKAPLDAVLDFNREKDGVFTVNSTNLPLTNYTYDIYSVQGQGVSGMFHPYRSQVGYVYDDVVRTNSSGLSAGTELGGGGLFDVGADIEVNSTINYSGIWDDHNEVFNNGDGSFEESGNEDPRYEEVYFKNVGDMSVDQNQEMYGDGIDTRLGGYDPIQFKMGSVPFARKLKNNYLKKGESADETGWPINGEEIKRDQRVMRNQTVLKVNALEAEELLSFERNPAAKHHHTAGFIVTRNDGARYVYGKSLYNTTKKEVTFALGEEVGLPGFLSDDSGGNSYTGLVPYTPGVDNSLDNSKGDHFFNCITTPGYAHTFLLTSLLSTDYSDIDGIAGPSQGDLGSYTLFQYRDMGNYKWRVPFEANQATYNEGLRTDPTDDKGSYMYGEKELSYIEIIETKTHVAVFHISPRKDAHGVVGENGGINSSAKMYQLDKIILYSRGEFYNPDGTKKSGTYDAYDNFTSDATPIKTVHFVYSYKLCKGVPNYVAGDEDEDPNNNGGKLTLDRIYFTYRDSEMGKYSDYNFIYGDADHNPDYDVKGYDIWGSPKSRSEEIETAMSEDAIGNKTLDPLSLAEFNYVEQNTVDDIEATHTNAAAWSITDIELPSGGKIQIDYEADDYQYVQDKKAMRMFKLAGAGDLENPNVGESKFTFLPNNEIGASAQEGLLYKGDDIAKYLYFELDEEDQDLDPTLEQSIFREKYLKDIFENQKGLLQFRMFLNMTPGGGDKSGSGWKDTPFDFVSGYAELENIQTNSFFIHSDGRRYGSIKLKEVKMEGGLVNLADEIGGVDASFKVNPISKAGWHFGRKYLSKYVYGMPHIDEGIGAPAMLNAMYQTLENMAELVVGPNGVLKSKKIARRFVPEKSWIRLGEPTKHKKGGGCRVKKLVMTDEWASMTSGAPSLMDQKYGQEYSYKLEDGGSSGVATYEPLGSKENPFVQPVFVNTDRLLAPDDDNYMEKPFGESFFPNPTITYSRVTVKNLERVDGEKRVTKHATGEVVTEFFTSRDYPTITDQTRLNLHEDQNPLLANFFSLNVMKHLTLSQGYVVHLNDMNGKMRSQRVYAEGQEGYISGVDYKYDLNSPDAPSSQFGNKGKLDNKVWNLKPNGEVTNDVLGVEQHIVNDFREMKSETYVVGVDGQANTFNLGPIVLVVPSFFPKFSRHVTKLNIATTTKVINTFGVLKETIAHDAGASVSTRNLLWDSQTGEVLVTETVNEYNDKYYSFNFPAHWHYKGMAQAAYNSGLTLPIQAAVGAGYYKLGPSLIGHEISEYLMEGDEVLVVTEDGPTMAWVTSADDVANKFYLMSKNGSPVDVSLAETGGALKVIRSGRRNLQSSSMASIVSQVNPFDLFDVVGGNFKLNTEKLKVLASATPEGANHWSKKRIVNAGAVEFKDAWELQCECNIANSTIPVNPYVYNTKGVWRAYRSHLYLTGRHRNPDNPEPRNDGFYNSFSSFYALEDGNWTISTGAYTDWTYTSRVTQFSPYGFELENADALERYSSAQYGYNFSFPKAVAANAGYNEMGYDGFEDYDFKGCEENEHFGFQSSENESVKVLPARAHTGKKSMWVSAGTAATRTYRYNCVE
jgi:hypothetical protein